MVIRVLSQPNHPARLAAIFLGALAILAIVASAAYAGAWVWSDITADPAPAPGGVIGSADVETGDGLVVLTPVEDAAAFEERTGFAPFVPERVPEGTEPMPSFAVTPPNEEGERIGRVAFSARRGYEREGLSGPVVVISQGKGAPGDGVNGALRQIGDGRALASAFPCGDLVLDVQLYFSPDDVSGPAAITPYMRELAEDYVRGIMRDCA